MVRRLAAKDPRQDVRRALRDMKSLVERARWCAQVGGTAVRAVCWQGVSKLTTETLPDPVIRHDQDVILKVRLSTMCGSDVHLLGGYVLVMEAGDVLGHEFLGDVVEVGSAVRRHKAGDRLVVASFIG